MLQQYLLSGKNLNQATVQGCDFFQINVEDVFMLEEVKKMNSLVIILLKEQLNCGEVPTKTKKLFVE